MSAPRDGFRWTQAEEEAGAALFPDERALARHVGRGSYQGLEFLHVNARRIINEVPASSRVPFRFTVNAYRGCSHACTYCFARLTHEYLGLNSGEDFERRIVVKVNAVERLETELASPRWSRAPIAMGTNTDPYQAAEGKYHLTRGIVAVLAKTANPFSIVTKSTLILRDLELLGSAAERTSVSASLSIGTLDRDVWRLTEPGTPPPDRRLEAVRRLNEAGVPCGVLIAPVLPGLSDREEQVRAVAEAAAAAGASSVSVIPLHLRRGVREHYLSWLEGARPDLLPLYRRRFAAGAYQAAEHHARLAAAAGSVTISTKRPPPRRASQERPVPDRSRQLRLL